MVLNIVMVEPEIPLKRRATSRAPAPATGAKSFAPLGPMGFKIDDKKLKRAGLDYWHLLDITYYDSLDEFFLQKQRRIFSFSPQNPSISTRIYTIPIIATSSSAKRQPDCREDLLFKNKDRCVRIPMISGSAQLNPPTASPSAFTKSCASGIFPRFPNGRLRGYDWDAADANGAK